MEFGLALLDKIPTALRGDWVQMFKDNLSLKATALVHEDASGLQGKRKDLLQQRNVNKLMIILVHINLPE